jgi:hypothetical protein
MTHVLDSPFLTIAETAELMRVKPRTLDNLRWRREGPPYRRHGGRILYHRDEVLEWSRQRRARIQGPPEKKDEAPSGDRTRGPQRHRDRSDKS